ncbi:telomere-protecting terminal protein Tpg [Streptomyces sp. NPDC004685]
MLPFLSSLSAGTVQEALDRADSRHWTRNPPRSLQARLGYLLKQHHGDTVALANLLSLTPTELDALRTAKQTPAEHPVHQAAEREVVRAWQPQVRRRAHATIVANGGQMMVSFRARFGFAATAGSSDDPRLRYLTLHLEAPYPCSTHGMVMRQKASCTRFWAMPLAPATSFNTGNRARVKTWRYRTSTSSSSISDRVSLCRGEAAA